MTALIKTTRNITRNIAGVNQVLFDKGTQHKATLKHATTDGERSVVGAKVIVHNYAHPIHLGPDEFVVVRVAV